MLSAAEEIKITSFVTKSEELETRVPHEYIRDTLTFGYKECKSCGNRTELTCTKCGFCYSCHWKKEGLEKKLLMDKLDDFSSSRTTDESTDDDELLQQQKEEQEAEETQVTIDVFGQKSEPICTYYRCNHKFSLHGLHSSHGCRCKHPTNRTLGVFIRYS